MTSLVLHENPEVAAIFKRYQAPIKEKLLALRALIIETAQEIDAVTSLEETLKWGEPSYISPIGSTIRINCKSKQPNLYAMYFQCTSKLIPTFKILFHHELNFEGNRAIVFDIKNELPVTTLKYCIKAGLTYHKVKHLPHLGI